MKVFSEDRREFAAEASIGEYHGMMGVFLESRSGRNDSPTERNPDYLPALESILARCQAAGINDHRVWVASRRLEKLPLEQRAIRVNGDGKSAEEIRHEICRKQIGIRENPGTKGGCPVKRIFIQINPVNLAPLEALGKELPPETWSDLQRDERELILQSIKARKGQAAFRESLIKAYAGRCAATGCAVRSILEAAHILPYRGKHTSKPNNGLLLRADWHTLFDIGLFHLMPDFRIRLDESLRDSEYWPFNDELIRLPEDAGDRPDSGILAIRIAEIQRERRTRSPHLRGGL